MEYKEVEYELYKYIKDIKKDRPDIFNGIPEENIKLKRLHLYSSDYGFKLTTNKNKTLDKLIIEKWNELMTKYK